MANNALTGTWEVINAEFLKGTNTTCFHKYIKCMEGIRVRLDENGDVTWTVPEELKSVPLFSCETYELYRHTGRSGIVLGFGAYAGHVFEFTAEKCSKESVTLTCEGICTLHCIKVKDDPPEINYSTPFTLLPALEDEYFSDMTITSSNNKQFKVHSTILELQGDDIDWSLDPPPFSNIPEDVLGTILHFLYVECLPESLTEDTARHVITVASPYASLSKLVNSCQLYLKNVALKQQIISLVTDMHSCISQIIDRFHQRNNPTSGENVAANPSKLCFIVKQSIRDAAVAGVKLLLLCDLFTKRKNELTRHERHEIIRYAKSRLPIFLSQLTRFLQALKNTFSSMSPAQRVEIATFLEPECEVILDTISMLTVHVEKTLQQIIQGLFTPDVSKCKSSVGDMLSKTIRNLLHIRELTMLQTIHDHINFSLGVLLHKKENFHQMSSTQKIRSVARTLEQLVEELPIFLIRLNEIASTLDDNLQWRDFKFCFKVGTSKVSDILQKLIVHIDSLQDVMVQLCELVQREAFTETLKCLGLLNSSTSSSHCTETPKMTRSSSYCTPKHHSYKLNLVKSLCAPVDFSKSSLSHQCLKLLNDQRKADMEFEIIGNNLNVENSETSENVCNTADESCTIKSHRVIVAARCDWFRRALLSGMREAIDKKIVIHDTSPFLFRILLEYLYSGRLQQSSLSTEQLVELLLLSDRYEMDSLKHTCEHALLTSIDCDSALYFLSMADQYNARILKSRCLNFISQHHELTESEEFFELPISLQAEMFDCVWTTQPSGRHSDVIDFGLERLLPTSSASRPGTYDITSAMWQMLLTSELEHSHPNDTMLENLHLAETSSRMDSCISQLRDILGDTAPRDALVQAILAADFDLQRAVNFYYARGNEDE